MAGEARPEATESCLRCGAAMEWRHATLQCPRCRLKVGCCEGETGDCRPQDAAFARLVPDR